MVIFSKAPDDTDSDSPAFQALAQVVDRDSCVRTIISSADKLRSTDAGWQIPSDRFQGTQGPTVAPLDAGNWLLALPLPSSAGGSPQFVAGLIRSADEHLVERLAQSVWDNLQWRQKCTEQRDHLDQYADQVLHDFAELHWMQELVSHLKVCSLSNDLNQTAQALLTPLRQLVRAQAMGFISAAETSQDRVRQKATGAFPGVWVADDDRLQATALQLLSRYSSESCSQVVVRNRAVAWPEASQFPLASSFMLVAVRRESRVTGWLIGMNRTHGGDAAGCAPLGANSVHTDDEFSTAEAGLLASTASILATHDHNVRLLQGNIRLSLGIIRALANTVDAKDEYTRGHSDRVARMARQLGTRLQLSARQCQQLLITGLLHDIGKIGIPDHVLQKPGHLSEDEFAVIRQHPEYGFRILQPVSELHFALPGVLHHHEAYDGSGYPHGLSRAEIPLMGRILAIVDTYDAMTSDRPYRSGMEFTVAEDILRRGAGQFWDPELVAIFLQHRQEFRQICQDSCPQHDSFSMVDIREIVLHSEDTPPEEQVGSERSQLPDFTQTDPASMANCVSNSGNTC